MFLLKYYIHFELQEGVFQRSRGTRYNECNINEQYYFEGFGILMRDSIKFISLAPLHVFDNNVTRLLFQDIIAQ